MGTRGNYVFRYKRKYYVFYNHWDSYFSGLGDDIVKELQQMKPEDFDKMKVLIEKIKQRENYDGSGSNFEGIMCALLNSDVYRLEEIIDCEPENDLFIEYIYILDLDNDVFKVKYWGPNDTVQSNRFRLSNIPSDWKDFVADLL